MHIGTCGVKFLSRCKLPRQKAELTYPNIMRQQPLPLPSDRYLKVAARIIIGALFIILLVLTQDLGDDQGTHL